MSDSAFNKTSVGKKILMALSGFFLLFFLLQHFAINFLSVISEDMFNNVSHFMGTNPLVQFLLQPVLLFGVIFHLAMGIVLDAKNKSARPVKYQMNSASANSSWMSRNMIITGLMILAFLCLHFYDFWFPEIKTKYIDGDLSGLLPNGDLRYFEELVHKFHNPMRVALYCVSFIFLSLHLLHGFQSSFQSVGFRHNRYTPTIKKLGNLYAIIIPAGFVFIALFHYINSL
jgi:succinate dehydrogenase / fumarate reductase, cytochrome b subunit